MPPRPHSRTPEGLRALVRAGDRLRTAPTPTASLAIAADRIARGANFQLAARWAVEAYGEPTWQRALGMLAQSDRHEWEGEPVPIGVYRFGALRRAMQAVAHAVRRPEDEVVAPFYAFVTAEQLGTVQRLVARVTTPAFAISKVPALWRGLFTIGAVRLEKTTTDSARMRFTVPGCLVDWLAPFCLGASSQVVELAGGGGATVWEAERRALGADTWDVAFTVDWRSELDA